jgi:uncharacterized protein (DUF362 family)
MELLPSIAGTTVTELSTHLDALASQQHAEGGWGYAPGQPPDLEPTCLALLALSLERERFAAAIERGQRALEPHRQPDGTYHLNRGRPEAVWPTALVLFTRASLGASAEDLRPTAQRLLAVKGKTVDDVEAGKSQDINVQLVGWPWGEGTFSWAEPTAWACLALRRAGYADHPRVAEGQNLLLDRAFDEGGINYGNRATFGSKTEPEPSPTALMLLALQGHAPHPRLESAVAYLRRQAETGDDLEHLTWTRIALHANGVDVPDLDERIRTAHQQRGAVPWLRPAYFREALTALALGVEQGNPFRFSAARVPQQPPAVVPVVKPPRQSLGERLRLKFRSWAVEAACRLRPLPPQTPVHIAAVTDYNADLADVLRRQYEHFREKVPLAGKRVVLKPNLVEYRRERVINTHPNVIAAAIELCQREGAAEVLIAEGPGHWRNAEYLVSASGLGDVLRHYRVSFTDLNHDEPVKTANLGRCTGLEHLYLTRTILSADVLISLPKLKTHHWTGATLSLKNLFGTMPGICYGWPKNELHWRGIENSIVDIALTRTPDLAIVDAIVGMEGDGPLHGTAKPLGAIVMGCDPLAVDATCCRLMQLSPERLGYLFLAHQKHLGLLAEESIQQLGEAIKSLARPFETLPQFHPLYVGRSA